MSTAFTCTTPEDGWSLYSHFLGNCLLPIRCQVPAENEEDDEAKRDKRERIISDSWLKLAGSLYLIMRRMRSNGHNEVADNMQQIIDMVVELDLTDPKVHEAIHEKQRELDPNQSKFDAELAKLRAGKKQ
ncbi:MAG: hypothetical protein NTX82_05585 [Candidatus Parcubacteria bacterium]|nr:hypothetical protein [Candidatus Parcubacteria bacterium]